MRYLSYSIDTTLLTAALMLLTILPASMFANGWLTLKLVLLVVYVVLGTLALKRGKTRRVRAISFVAALLTYGRSEEHTSELQSLMRISYAVFCLKKKKQLQT